MKSKTKTLGKLLRFAVEVCSGKDLGVGISCEMRLLFHHQIKSIHYMWVIESIVEEKNQFIYYLPKSKQTSTKTFDFTNINLGN